MSLNNYRINKNYFIIITFLLFLILDIIKLNRLIIFIIILLIILIYKFIIELIINKSFNRSNNIISKLLILFNKWRNPILICLLKLDIIIFDLICKYDNQILNNFIFIIYILIINPIKIFYYKYYNILFLWKINKIYIIIFNRMFGLILSILVFTNIISYLNNVLGLKFWILLYLYLLIISILSELYIKEEFKNKFIKIFLVSNISSYNLIYNRLEINIISLFLKANRINEIDFYINEKSINKIEKFRIGHTWFIINLVKNLKNKPSFNIYLDLKHLLDLYLLRIVDYIYFDFYNWDIPNIKNKKDLLIFKTLYEYDYKVFKILLFLVWDIEVLLNYNIKNSLSINKDDIFYNFIINYEIIFEKTYFKLIKDKKEDIFWSYFNILNRIKLYEIYYYSYNNKYKNESINNTLLNNYIKYRDITLDFNINKKDKNIINISIYNQYIDILYKEWYDEKDFDKFYKYTKKFVDLENSLNFLKYLLLYV